MKIMMLINILDKKNFNLQIKPSSNEHKHL